MGLGVIRHLVSRRPGWVVGSWLIVAAVVGVLSPDLTRLAAEGQARMLASGAESRRAAELVRQCWPDQAYESMVVAVLHRPGGLTGRRQAIRRAIGPAVRGRRAARGGPPRDRARHRRPRSPQRLVSPDGTVALVAVSLASSFVAPVDARGRRLDRGDRPRRRARASRPDSRSAGRATP